MYPIDETRSEWRNTWRAARRGKAVGGADHPRKLPGLDPRGLPEGVLAVALDVLRTAASGKSTEHAVCTCLAREVGAMVAAYVALNPGAGTATVFAWSPSLTMVGSFDQRSSALPNLLDQLAIDSRVLFLSAGTDEFGWCEGIMMSLKELLRCGELALVPLNVPGRGRRLVVLGRGRSFCGETAHLLECLRGPLSDLVCVAGEQPFPAAYLDAGHGLTDREIEVLRLMAQGLLARTIAVRLQVSPRTVHKHLGSIYRKLDVHDRLVAVRRAEGLGLLVPNPTHP